VPDPAVEGAPLVEFWSVMRQLRAECPWKAEQTHRSLARYLLEETHETLEAIEVGEDAHLAEELGDLLLQVYFHAAIAAERGAFDLDDVARGITEKMRRRNPHVFGTPEQRASPGDAAAVDAEWQAIKAVEKAEKGATPSTDDLPPTLPALLYAAKTLERRARSAAAPAPADAPAPAGVPTRRTGADDIGDRLLALVAEANTAGVDPEQALRDAVRRTS
jgi:XTP/dITP diphosphohydrolase